MKARSLLLTGTALLSLAAVQLLAPGFARDGIPATTQFISTAHAQDRKPDGPSKPAQARDEKDKDKDDTNKGKEQRNAPEPKRQAAPPAQPQQQRAAPTPAPQPPAAQTPQRTQAPPPALERAQRREERREEQRDNRRDERPEQRQTPPAAQPATPPQNQQQPAPSAPQPQQPAQQRRTPAQTQQPAQQQPAPAQQPAQRQQQPSQQQQTAPPQPAAAPLRPRDARDFIRRDNQAPTVTIDQLRQQRQQTRDGNRTVIREGDRTIVRQGDRTIIRHNEVERFAIGARDVRTDRRGNQTVTTVVRPDGSVIITTTDSDGRLIRRVRRLPDGRQVVIIDNSRRGPRYEVFINLPPPRIRIPRNRYIVEAWDTRPEVIYDVFLAQPIEPISRRYTLEQIRYSEPLRARMPRVDLDVNFETGSWQLTPDQVRELSVIAEGLKRAISRNAREVYLIEGHTDAVGSDDDNLSLSDRRAESVAVALTEQFQVPAENLVTQGYGEQHLKEPTDAPSRANRRVSIRRITPLIDQQASR